MKDYLNFNTSLFKLLEARKRSYDEKVEALCWLAAALTLGAVIGGLIAAAAIGLWG